MHLKEKVELDIIAGINTRQQLEIELSIKSMALDEAIEILDKKLEEAKETIAKYSS